MGRTLLVVVLVVVLLLGGLVALARVGEIIYQYEHAQRAAAEAPDHRGDLTDQARQLLNREEAAAPRIDGRFPCVFANVDGSSVQSPQLGRCALPLSRSGPVDRFEADLRYGRFVLRESDLYVNDVFDVPLTRTYNSEDDLSQNSVHAFGKSANHAPGGGPYAAVVDVTKPDRTTVRVTPGDSVPDFVKTPPSNGRASP